MIHVKYGRKTEATLAQEVFKNIEPNSRNMGNILAHNSGPWPRTEILPPPSESTHQDLTDGRGRGAIGSQKRVVMSVQR